jgi:hypothetical protein
LVDIGLLPLLTSIQTKKKTKTKSCLLLPLPLSLFVTAAHLGMNELGLLFPAIPVIFHEYHLKGNNSTRDD